MAEYLPIPPAQVMHARGHHHSGSVGDGSDIGSAAADSRDSENSSSDNSDYDDSDYGESRSSEGTEGRTLLPTVRFWDWGRFANRFGADEKLDAVDVLVGDNDLQRVIANEERRRKRWERQRRRQRRRKRKGEARQDAETSAKKEATTGTGGRESHISLDADCIQRIRIRSIVLLDILGRIYGHSFERRPHIFERPFCHLVDAHEELEGELRSRESELDHTNGRNDGDYAVRMLRAYMEFANAYLLPAHNKYQTAGVSLNDKVCFADLWRLFQPGDFVWVPPQVVADNAGRNFEENRKKNVFHNVQNWVPGEGMQRVWRVGKRTTRTLLVDKVPTFDFVAMCHYLDYDGSSYGAVELPLVIDKYAGDKIIGELGFYPLRLSPRASEIMAEQRECGASFVASIAAWHMVYDGWTFSRSPMGRLYIGERDAQMHIEGEVIVDFGEATKQWPTLREDFTDWELQQYRNRSVDTRPSHCAFIIWTDTKRSGKVWARHELLVDEDGYWGRLSGIPQPGNKYMQREKRPTEAPCGDDLALLPPRVFVYALRGQRAVAVDHRKLRAVQFEDGAFDQLRLLEEHKHIIQSIVEEHARKKAIEDRIVATTHETLHSQDFIAGKGRGMLLLLHGEPGVGKTATAEAVAQMTRRPLFQIACSDLWKDPRVNLRTDIETGLDSVFRLAHRWNCVLLMDEADVFLSARGDTSFTDMTVSVFLRRLEYYNGILFLTTNRIGKIDQAVSSRICLILHYKRLDQADVESIFRNNVRRLQRVEEQESQISGNRPIFIIENDVMRFVSEHYARHPGGKGVWNGRQIRNAFTIAASLVHREAGAYPSGSDFQPQLRACHFEQVERLFDNFRGFRERVQGNDDAAHALIKGERDDNYPGEPIDKINSISSSQQPVQVTLRPALQPGPSMAAAPYLTPSSSLGSPQLSIQQSSQTQQLSQVQPQLQARPQAYLHSQQQPQQNVQYYSGYPPQTMPQMAMLSTATTQSGPHERAEFPGITGIAAQIHHSPTPQFTMPGIGPPNSSPAFTYPTSESGASRGSR